MEYKLVCKIVSTHGLKGEVKIFLNTTEIDKRFKKGNSLFLLLDDKNYLTLTVNTFKQIDGKFAFVTFKGFDDINKIEKYLKKEIYGEKLEFKNKIYYSDLVGFSVLYRSSPIGEISEITLIAGKEYMIINNRYVPFIKNVFYINLNEENKTIELTDMGKDVYLNA